MKLNQFSTTPLVFILLLAGCTTSFQSQYQKGKKYFEEKNYAQAVDSLNQAIPKWRESDGTFQQGEAYQLLGKSYHAMGNIDRAADAYKQAIKLSSQSFDSAYALALIYLTSKQSQQALATFRTALEMKPKDPIALIGFGNTYYELGDYANAFQMYQRVLDVSPGVRDALQYSNLAKEKMGHRSSNRIARMPTPPKKKAAAPSRQSKPKKRR